MKYAMFMRGINVGGIRVPMKELAACLGSAGMKNVRTFLQTGNVLFESDSAVGKLKVDLEKQLSREFSYAAHVLIYPAAVLVEIVEHYPFARDEGNHSYAIFCENQTVLDDLASHKDSLNSATEQIAKGSHVVFWTVPKGHTLDTPFSKILAKPKYKEVTTNRNVNTLEKMAASL
jgi:uncharacterized protein (DUF1697 family)